MKWRRRLICAVHLGKVKHLWCVEFTTNSFDLLGSLVFDATTYLLNQVEVVSFGVQHFEDGHWIMCNNMRVTPMAVAF